jgi:hypothetical protein
MRRSDPPHPRLEALRQETLEILAEATADREQNLVRNVVLLGPASRNGYRYTAEAMQQAVPLYEQRPIFLDHAETAAAPTRRALRDFAGQVVQPRLEGERLRGDLRLLGPHTAWLFDLIEAAPRDIGMSHVVLGRRNPDGQSVEHIERVISVDIVAFPATTSSFQEQQTEAIPDWARRLLDQSSLPDALRNEALLQVLAAHPEPGRFVQALEQFAERLQHETPRSSAKRNLSDTTLSLGTKQAMLAAITGN